MAYQDKFYTEEGKKALRNRAENFIHAFNTKEFPLNRPCLGFGDILFESKIECENRIKEICQLLGLKHSKIIVRENNADGTAMEKEEIRLEDG